VSSSPERNDRKRGNSERFHSRKPGGPGHVRGPGERGGADWLWGWHAVVAALENPRRGPPRRLLATPDRAKALTQQFGYIATLEVKEAKAIGDALALGAVHQGVALKPEPLESLSIDELAGDGGGFILMLDQVTDPQNVGAIFRSAAAFGARGVILQDRHAPVLTGALAKAAAGAVDAIPYARVTNLSRALEQLSDLGWRAVGLSGDADEPLEAVLDSRPTVLVLGSEGEGIRRLVSEHCDALGRIPMPGGFESLNVSAAAAIALYEVSRPR
jgi:23S rRNA (guanosine2251-2'-O)-methyltransferase